jgi:transcriptional regulator with XRE-family HTH domain
MATSASSSVQQARRVLADRLAEIRRDAGLTGRDLAIACSWYPSKVSRIEHARTAPSVDDIRAWCRACSAEGKAPDLIASLRAVEGMFVEWRRMERAGLKHAQIAVRPLFERTRRFRAYSSWFIPGLIQSRTYTEAVQRRRVEVDDVTAAVDARMERQQLLHAPGKTWAFLLEESVLRSGIGGAEVMVGQLGHLITVSALPSVSVGVIPAGPERTRMPVEGFWVFDSAQVSVELVSGHLTLTQAPEVALYADTFTELAGHAVYGADARALVVAAIEALH